MSRTFATERQVATPVLFAAEGIEPMRGPDTEHLIFSAHRLCVEPIDSIFENAVGISSFPCW
jgi:hypothetical protein